MGYAAGQKVSAVAGGVVTSRSYYYILDGHDPVPADFWSWSAWSTRTYDNWDAMRRVGRDEVDGVSVLTDFLGLDHGSISGADSDDPRPVLFETMTFAASAGAEGDPRAGYMWRYHTWEGARAGHDAIVARLRAGQPLDPDDWAGPPHD